MTDDVKADGVEEEKEVTLQSSFTNSLPVILNQMKISILLSTYQAGKMIVLRAEGNSINTHFRDFNVPMGVALKGVRLAVGTRFRIWEYQNQADVASKLAPAGRPHDACYMPRASHLTGHIQIHEMAFAKDELWFVNTRFSCLCTLAPDCSFVPRWRPPFITKLAMEDRCHLNGLAVRNDRVQYVTALGTTDTKAGWRENKAHGGILMDVPSKSIVCSGLSMPHSPRWHDNRLWVCESGAGSLSVVNEFTGKLEHIAMLPGFTRGLDFVGPIAFIGLSQVRESAIFSGIPITDRLKPEERMCGLCVVDTRNGQMLGFLRFDSGVQEIFAVQVLPGITYPEILCEGVNDELLENSFVIPAAFMGDVAYPKEEKEEAKS